MILTIAYLFLIAVLIFLAALLGERPRSVSQWIPADHAAGQNQLV
jgi:hypothetical protein